MRQVVGSRIWDSGLSKLIAFAERLLTVAYRPRPDERAYLERAKTQKNSDVEVTAAALSDRASQAFFRVRMARKGMQPVWIDIRNGSGNAFRLEPFSIDPAYYPPLEAAYVNHFAMLKRLLSFGLLAWIFLPVLPLLPFKLYGAGKDLLLEYVGDNDMVLVQQLVSGDCANGTRIVLRRDGKRLRGQWLKVDKSAWLGAHLQRHSSPYTIP